METDNPILRGQVIEGEFVETQRSTFSSRPTPRTVPASIKRLVAQLGLRYRPSAQADLDAHAASLALLATDLADIPADMLDRAIRDHVASSPYMPKAADLIAKCRGYLQREPDGQKVDRDSRENAERLAEKGNTYLKAHGKFNMRWAVNEQNALVVERA